MADFALQKSTKLISRKIWVIEKLWNFHTVSIFLLVNMQHLWFLFSKKKCILRRGYLAYKNLFWRFFGYFMQMYFEIYYFVASISWLSEIAFLTWNISHNPQKYSEKDLGLPKKLFLNITFYLLRRIFLFWYFFSWKQTVSCLFTILRYKWMY